MTKKKKKVLIISVPTVDVVLLDFQKATESICLFNKYQNSFQDTAVPSPVMTSSFVQLLLEFFCCQCFSPMR